MTDLAELYRQAVYVVEDGDISFRIRLGRKNHELNHYLAVQQIGNWAFLTAYNPNSTPIPDSKNLKRQSQLIDRLNAAKYRYLNGYGTSESGDWPPEASLFVADIDRNEAMAIARDFGQHAILYGRSGGDAELVWCD